MYCNKEDNQIKEISPDNVAKTMIRGEKAITNIKNFLSGETDESEFLQQSAQLTKEANQSSKSETNRSKKNENITYQAEKKEKNLSKVDDAITEITIYPTPINPSQLLQEIEQLIKKVIVCSDETAVAATLWTAMTWLIDDIQVAPLAVITAPEKRCGKSQFISLIGKLVLRPLPASNITTAALFRSIELWKPTILLDEADTFLKGNEDLRGIINAGHSRGSAFVIRVVGKEHIPQKFSVWGAKAIAGIGSLSDTLMDRAINLRMRRKRNDEKVVRLKSIDDDIFQKLTSMLARFSNDYSQLIRKARPRLPNELNDREQDNWEPLFAIADVAGNDWAERARKAALNISKSNQNATTSIGIELLSAIHDVFQNKMIARISTAELIKTLCSDEEQAWSTFNRGQPISPRQLATLLKEYGIQSKGIRIGYGTPKGYEKEQFTEAFARYLLPEEKV